MAGTVGVTFSIGAAVSRTVASAFGTVQSRVRGLKSDLKELDKQSRAVERLSADRARLETAQARYAAESTEANRLAVRTAAYHYKNAQVAVRAYGLDVRKAGEAQEQLAARIEKTKAALSRQERLQANQAKRKELQGQALGVIGTAMTVAAPVKLAIDYESSFADLKKVANFADAAQEKRVQQDIFEVARRSGISAGGMTAIAASAAESGVVNDADGNLDPARLKQFLSDAAEMAVAYGISAEQAGERLAVFQSRMGLNAEQTKAMGDAMNYLASKTNATAAKTSEVISRVGAVGVTAGLSAKSIVGLAGAFVSTSEGPEVAATAMKSFLLAMAQGDAMSKTQKKAFAKIGIHNVKALAEGMKKGGADAENTIMTVFEAMRKLPEAEQAGIAKDIFGLESFASIAPLVNDPAKLAKAFSLANSKEAVGSQLREFETRSNTTAGALDRLKTSTGILGITVGSVLLPPLATAANTAVAVVKPITALAERFPVVTRVVMLTALALVALKVGALAGMYAATILSDGWVIARRALHFLRPSVMWANASLVAHRVYAVGAAVATRTLAAGQWLLNAALSNNPVGWVVKGVAALTAGMVYLYNTYEPVRAAFDAVFGFIGEKLAWVTEGVGTVVDKFKAIGDWFTGDDEDEKARPATPAEPQTTAVPPLSSAAPKAWTPDLSGMSPEAMGAAFPGMAAVPQITAVPPLSATAPKAWTPDLSGMSPEAMGAAFPGMTAGTGGGMAAPDTTALPGTGAPAFNLTFSLNGIPDADFGKRVIDGLKRHQNELESLIAGIVNEQRRLAYG